MIVLIQLYNNKFFLKSQLYKPYLLTNRFYVWLIMVSWWSIQVERTTALSVTSSILVQIWNYLAQKIRNDELYKMTVLVLHI